MYTDQSQWTKFETAAFLITFIMVCHTSMGRRGWCWGCLCCGRGWRWGCLCCGWGWHRLCGRGWRWGWGLGVGGRQEVWGWLLLCGWSSGRGWWCRLFWMDKEGNCRGTLEGKHHKICLWNCIYSVALVLHLSLCFFAGLGAIFLILCVHCNWCRMCNELVWYCWYAAYQRKGRRWSSAPP